MRRVTTLLAVLALAAGCGGEEEKDVKDAFGAWASATKTGNGTSYCDGLTKDSVQLIERVANPIGDVTQDCDDTMDQRLRADDEAGGALDQDDLAALEKAEVEIEGDRAELKDDSGMLAMRKETGEWRVDLAGTPDVGYELRVETACGEDVGERLVRQLPEPTREGVAGEAEAEAKSLTRMRRTLSEADPPAKARAAAERLDRSLGRAAERWRTGAKALRGLGAPLASYNKAGADVQKIGRSAAADARKVGLYCVTQGAALPNSEDYVRDAERACKRTVEEVEDLKSPAAFRGAIARAAPARRDRSAGVLPGQARGGGQGAARRRPGSAEIAERRGGRAVRAARPALRRRLRAPRASDLRAALTG